MVQSALLRISAFAAGVLLGVCLPAAVVRAHGADGAHGGPGRDGPLLGGGRHPARSRPGLRRPLCAYQPLRCVRREEHLLMRARGDADLAVDPFELGMLDNGGLRTCIHPSCNSTKASVLWIPLHRHRASFYTFIRSTVSAVVPVLCSDFQKAIATTKHRVTASLWEMYCWSMREKKKHLSQRTSGES
uniref:Putative secreted protein n=1 Tax=Ixodes ricinus TaxID=34613 RepID=A0A6B0V181_IXORI